ncbi:hypothetical protein [Maridesulfovibrio bastinii]|uniref:hypothetical protein n=1 Tax=Maridesulfovibrio bastinii TaxID=47157 RepID=UPI0003F763ED|nr:hypothetical protein [Maridesulfovibrio bastinii]
MTISLPESFYDYEELINCVMQPELTIHRAEPSIDFVNVAVSFGNLHPSKVESFLEKHFSIKSSKYYSDKKKGVYEAEFTINGKTYRIFCFSLNKFKWTIFQFKDIDHLSIPYIISIFKGIPNHVSKIEYSLDFYTSDNGKFYEFLSSTALLKYHGKLFTHPQYSGTRYLNSVRTTSGIGSRIYIKLNKEECPVRLEATMARKALKSRYLTTIEDVVTVHPIVPFGRHQFMVFDHEKFNKNTNFEKPYEQDFFTLLNGSVNCGGVAAVRQAVSTVKNNPHHYFYDHYFMDSFTQFISEPFYLSMYEDAIKVA